MHTNITCIITLFQPIIETQGFSTLSYYAFDAVLVLAQAINDTLAGWSNNSPDWSFCETENEVNKTSLTRCFVRRKIHNVNINGTTVRRSTYTFTHFYLLIIIIREQYNSTRKETGRLTSLKSISTGFKVCEDVGSNR